MRSLYRSYRVFIHRPTYAYTVTRRPYICGCARVYLCLAKAIRGILSAESARALYVYDGGCSRVERPLRPTINVMLNRVFSSTRTPCQNLADKGMVRVGKISTDRQCRNTPADMFTYGNN